MKQSFTGIIRIQLNIVIGLQTAVLQLYFIWPHWSRTPANPEMEFFVTLVTGWKPQTNPTKGFLLHVAMEFLRCVSLKQILKLIKKPIKIDSFFLAFVWSLFLMNQALNNKYRIQIFSIHGLLCTTSLWVLSNLAIPFLLRGK